MGHLTNAQRVTLRQRIADELQRTQARAAALDAAFDDIVRASADAVRDDEHDPEGPTIAFERAQVATLLADARAKQAALGRVAAQLDATDAGRCHGCGTPIDFERMMARPTATRCTDCAR